MNDVFALPLRVAGNGDVKYRIMPNKRGRLSPLSDFTSLKAACHAINNHDRLVEEDQRLRNTLLKMVECFDDKWLNDKKYDALSEAKKLLSELEGDNNE